MANSTLNAAKAAKNDEFYTQLSDIENELRHYKEHFRGKTVLCNCDDPRVSNFFKYFTLNFEHLGLKRLITTCYKNQNVDLFSKYDCEQAVYLIYDGDKNGNKIPDAEEIGIHPLKGDGDFRSRECIELLKQADIVVTNPPFSLFREYVAQLIEYDKKFLIIGNMNALHYKEIFPLIKNGQIWTGYKSFGGGMNMIQSPNNFDKTKTKSYSINEQGEIIKNIMGCIWFTNLDHQKRHEELILYKRYSPEDYPSYDNFEGIDVSNVSEIPDDYYGYMGVPDTFLGCFNPEQFEIIGLGSGDLAKQAGVKKNYRGRTDLAFTKNGLNKCPYSRIIIRRKQQNKE